MSEPTPVNSQNELDRLYAEKGQLVSQLEIGQNRLMQVNQRLWQLLGVQQVPNVPR